MRHYILDENNEKIYIQHGDDVAQLLNVIKYEPGVPAHMAGQVGSLFGYTKSYDIENLKGNMNVFTDGEEVVATEKLHGTLCQVGFLPDLPEDKQEYVYKLSNGYTAFVTSKGQAKKGLVQKNTPDNDDNVYVKAYKQLFEAPGVSESIVQYLVNTKMKLRLYVFGEIFGKGVQDLDYGKQTPVFRVFDVYVQDIDGDKFGRYLDDAELDAFCQLHGLTRVPKLYKGPYSYEQMNALRGGNTVEGDNRHIREGIVIRPVVERYGVRGLPDGRAQVKFISDDYLLRKGGSEFQ